MTRGSRRSSPCVLAGLLRLGAGVAASILWASGALAAVRINEIFYHPSLTLGEDDDFEWVEIHNTGTGPVDVGGWVFKDQDDAHGFTIPAGTTIWGGGYLVLTRNEVVFRSVYGSSIPTAGDFGEDPVAWGLGNDSDTVRLFDAHGNLVDSVRYEDDLPWPPEADGWGATLERIDPDLDITDFSNFAASEMPDPTPGTPGAVNSKRGERSPHHDILITEIQYHPTQGEVNALFYDPFSDLRHCDEEEFIEIHNRGTGPIDISGWQFARGIRFTFPPKTTLDGKGYLVVYKDLAGFEAKYGPVSNKVGPYELTLDDGGEKIVLVDADGRPVDSVRYEDEDPWPVLADGLGRSLELQDPDQDNDLARNWRDSRDEHGTPGEVNGMDVSNQGGSAPPFITEVLARPADAPKRAEIRSTDTVRISAAVTDPDGVQLVVLEYQVVPPGDYVPLYTWNASREIAEIPNPRYETDWALLPMIYLPGERTYVTMVPPLGNRTLVRYRVTATGRTGRSITVPYLDGPQKNYAYFVYDGVPDYTADVASHFGPAPYVHTGLGGESPDLTIPVYFIIADADDIFDIQYVPRSYNDNVYRWMATFVFEGRVYDHVRIRLRGGVHRYHWPKRSWKIRFHKGDLFVGRGNDGIPYPQRRRFIHLFAEQHNDGRPRGESGVFESLAWKLTRDGGVMASQTTFTHVRIVDQENEEGQFDGDFFGIFLDIEDPDAAFLQTNNRSVDGSFYKMDGAPDKKNPDCDLSYADVNAFQSFIRAGHSREEWQDVFDVAVYLSFRVMVEFSHHYDMGSKNYYYYNNPDTGVWETMPWDMDNTFGADSGNGSEPFRDIVIPLFQQEYRNRAREMLQLAFSSPRMEQAIDRWSILIRRLADADLDRWDNEPYCDNRNDRLGNGTRGWQCDQYRPFEDRMRNLKAWIAVRRTQVANGGLGGGAEIRLVDSEPLIPERPETITPSAEELAPVPITLVGGEFTDRDGGTHGSSEWMVMAKGGDWNHPVWRSGPIEEGDLRSFALPEDILLNQEPYEWRVRYRDDAGWWSEWSDPSSFVASTFTDPTPPTVPGNLVATLITADTVELRWEPSTDNDPPASGVLGYRVYRNGQLLVASPIEDLEFIDTGTEPGTSYVYVVTAVNRGGTESDGAIARITMPEVFDGFWAPEGGWDYLYDARPGQALYTEEKDIEGNLDGSWMRSGQTDQWDGSAPGVPGKAPGGVEVLVVPGGSVEGADASVLAVEDPGDPRPTFPDPSNRRIYLYRPTGLGEDLLDRGVTFTARWRVHPGPKDVRTEDQSWDTDSDGKGQVGIVSKTLSRNFSLSLGNNMLSVALGGSLPVDDDRKFQVVWATIEKSPSGSGHLVSLYLNGSTRPVLDGADIALPEGTEITAPNDTYIALGSTRGIQQIGAIQIDFIGYKAGIHTPRRMTVDPPFRRGDVDADGSVRIGDAVAIIHFLFAPPGTISCADAADANDSGRVTLADPIYVLRKVFAHGPDMPAPGSRECGIDPTPDSLPRCVNYTCR